jgi:hypothetical protein
MTMRRAAGDEMTHADGSGTTRRPWRRVAVALLVAIAAMGTAELATRAHHAVVHGTGESVVPRHLVDFYRFYRVNPEYGSRSVEVNAQGFRDAEEVPMPKPLDEVRVFVTGGSTVWGEHSSDPFPVQITNEQTIAAHLERILQRKVDAAGYDVRVRVVNAGVVGYMLFQGLAQYVYVISHLQPDLVVALDGHNDLDALQLGVPSFRHRNDGTFEREMNHPTVLTLPRQLQRYLEAKSMFVRKSGAKARAWISSKAVDSEGWRRQFAVPPADSAIQRWLDTYSATVRHFDAVAHADGVPILFLAQVELAGESHKRMTPVETSLQEHWGYYRWLHGPMRARLTYRLEAMSRAQGLWFEDITDVFAGVAETAYIDYTHLSDAGAREVAHRIGTLVGPAVLCADTAHVMLRCRSATTWLPGSARVGGR